MINIKELETALNKTAKTLTYVIFHKVTKEGGDYDYSIWRYKNFKNGINRIVTLYETQTIDEMVKKVRGKF